MYDESKRFAESAVHAYVQTHGITGNIARIFNTYGPNMKINDGRVVTNFIYQALHGNDITIYGTGEQTRSFSYIEDAIIHENATIGPFSRLRGNVNIGMDCKIGNFVEVKNSVLHKDVKASHLSYLGDSNIEENANIGAGTITCNFDGVNKNKTHIGKNAFIGSNSSLVAPVDVGDNAHIGAGSVITKNVEKESLVLTRAPLKTVSNWAKKFLGNN